MRDVPPTDLADRRSRALEVLLDPAWAHAVALAAWLEEGWLHVGDARGRSRALLSDIATAGRESLAAVDVIAGVDPLRNVDPLGTGTDCYPWGWQRLASALRAGPRAPDVAAVHTGRHFWPERGGHIGEHGSLNAVQSRAPFLLAGAGVRGRGVVPGVARTVDVAATLASLAAAAYPDGEGRPAPHDGQSAPRHVVGLLWDGVPHAEVLDGLERGWLPNLAGLLREGYVLAGGAVAEFPSVTLVNHVSALTDVGPAAHGVVNNAFYDRTTGRSVVANQASSWHRACDLFAPGVRTVFEQVASVRPDALTACINEPADRGAGYSTFGLVRAAGSGDGAASMFDRLPDAANDPHASHEFVSEDRDYAWSTAVDALGLTQMLGLWQEGQPPALTWWNSTLTDSGHHAGGPGSDIARASIADADRRLGAWLDLLDRRGLREDTAVLLTADHGSEAADPTCRGDWDVALREAGVGVRDEAYGFLYFT